MRFIDDLSELESLYGSPGPAALRKVAVALTPEYRRWIAAARFGLLTTVGPEGTDCSPRGDDGPVVMIADDRTLLLPDWKGNDRIDSLRNIVRDPRLSLLFIMPGSNNVIRVNGTGRITDDEALRRRFARGAALPRTVLMVAIGEVYFQCARALMRSRLWSAAPVEALPTPGDMLAGASRGEEGGAVYDATWPERAARTMW